MKCRICHKELDNKPLDSYQANVHGECMWKEFINLREERSKEEEREEVEKPYGKR